MEEINNRFYNSYGEKWYTAQDDPIALLRAESKIKTPWVLERIKKHFPNLTETFVLDVGCGGGFLSNELATSGLNVSGVDLSLESLKTAHAHDLTGRVTYSSADAYDLPFPDHSFDVVCAMDFLEHLDRPDLVIKEFARVLKADGLFFFSTFNRNPLSYLLVIKTVQWFVKNTPKNMHLLKLFIKPDELKEYCALANMKILEVTGIRPLLHTISPLSLIKRSVPEKMGFKTTRSLLLSYIGVAKKIF